MGSFLALTRAQNVNAFSTQTHTGEHMQKHMQMHYKWHLTFVVVVFVVVAVRVEGMGRAINYCASQARQFQLFNQ